MALSIKPYDTTRETRKNIKKLYISAFPAEERAPFFLVMSKTKQKKAEMLIAKEDDEFVGFAYMVCDQNLAYLFYLAIDETYRGKGYGSAVLTAIKKIYQGKKIFLAREQLDPNADNYRQRKNRHQFYLHNGFQDLPCQIKEASVIYDVMGIGGTISSEEYNSLITNWSGKWRKKIIDMKVIEKKN